mgnify:CR=1 FL=1
MTSILKVDNIQNASGTGTPYITGAVLQVQYTQYTAKTNVSMSSGVATTVDVLAVNITPKSTSSIIRLDAHVFHEWNDPDAQYNSGWVFFRDSTKLAAPQNGNRLSVISQSSISYYNSDAGTTNEIVNYSYFDAPNTTNQITYKVGVVSHYNTNVHINSTKNDDNTTTNSRGISFISATEIGG